MKRLICAGLCIISLLVLGLSPASANSRGLKGELYKLVSSTDTWNDYSTLCRQSGDMAVMHSRYHNALMTVENGRLRVYTKAVYQPDDKRAKNVRLHCTDAGFRLSYGENEYYHFKLMDGIYRLTEAVIGNFRINACFETYQGFFYTACEGDQQALFYDDIPLSRFNITLLPHSVTQIKQRNLMRAALNSGADCLGRWEENEHGIGLLNRFGEGTAPVYSSPYGKSAWRAAKGKAAVGMNGEIWVLSYGYGPENYACIRYDVSPRTQRIGFVTEKTLRGLTDHPAYDPMERLLNLPVVALQDTYLTDDPDVSQYAQFEVPKGTQLTCMGTYGNDYAYVAAEVKNGRFTDGGQIVWGFVPLIALDRLPSVADTDTMRRLEGAWVMEAGGNMAEDLLVFHADGSYESGYADADGDLSSLNGAPLSRGTYLVTSYDHSVNSYWNKPPYEITLINENGRVNIKGLVFHDNGIRFSLTDVEGGGGYVRPEAMDKQ